LPDRFFLCPILFVCISALSPQCCAVPCAFAPSFFSSSVWLYPPLSPHPHLSTPKPVEWSICVTKAVRVCSILRMRNSIF
jgi:hypothetical protein